MIGLAAPQVLGQCVAVLPATAADAERGDAVVIGAALSLVVESPASRSV